MAIFRQIFRFYITSSIHVALAVVSLCVITMLMHGLDMDYVLLGFVFLSTISGYNFVKYAPIAKMHHRSLTQALRTIQVFSVFCAIGLFAISFFIKVELIWLSLALGLLNVFYAIPLPQKTLREVPFLKVAIIAFIWTVVTQIYPFIAANHSLPKSFSFYFEVAEKFLWVILLMIPFEIRDYRYEKTSLKTLATGLGIKRLKVLGLILASILTIIRIWTEQLDYNPFYLLVFMSFVLSILGSKEKQSDYYASFWVESLPIFWMISYVMLV
jgi:hypothetical protein